MYLLVKVAGKQFPSVCIDIDIVSTNSNCIGYQLSKRKEKRKGKKRVTQSIAPSSFTHTRTISFGYHYYHRRPPQSVELIRAWTQLL